MRYIDKEILKYHINNRESENSSKFLDEFFEEQDELINTIIYDIVDSVNEDTECYLQPVQYMDYSKIDGCDVYFDRYRHCNECFIFLFILTPIRFGDIEITYEIPLSRLGEENLKIDEFEIDSNG